MKKTGVLAMIFCLCLAGQQLMSNSRGAFRATGSPGHFSCVACHAGKMANADPLGSVTMSITGSPKFYVPGNTYEVVVTTSYNGRHKFGFACDAVDSNKMTAGIFSAAGSDEVQPKEDSSYITHTLKGTADQGNRRTWKFNWIAPLGDSGDVTLYAASVAANGDNLLAGDRVYTTSLKLHSPQSVAVAEIINEPSLKIYPVPAHSFIDLDFFLNEARDVSVTLYDLTGKKVEQMQLHEVNKGENRTRILFTENHLPGIYLLNIEAGQTTIRRKVIID